MRVGGTCVLAVCNTSDENVRLNAEFFDDKLSVKLLVRLSYNLEVMVQRR